MACSEAGAINRLSTIAQASWRTVSGRAAIVQNAIKAETLPELIADVDRPGFTMLLGRDPSWIDGDQLRTGGRPWRRRVLTALSYLMNDGGDFG